MGDIVEVTYNGNIEEIYPAVLGGVTSIRVGMLAGLVIGSCIEKKKSDDNE